MPLFVGDFNVQNFVNQLEKRLEAVEAAVAKMPKSVVTSSSVEKMVEEKVAETVAASPVGIGTVTKSSK